MLLHKIINLQSLSFKKIFLFCWVFFFLIVFYSFNRRRWNHITVLRTCCVLLVYLYSWLVCLHFYIIYTSLFTLCVTGFLWLHFFFSGPHCTSSFKFVASHIKFSLLYDIHMKRFSYDEVCIRNSCWHKIFMQKALHFYYYSIQISWYY